MCRNKTEHQPPKMQKKRKLPSKVVCVWLCVRICAVGVSMRSGFVRLSSGNDGITAFTVNAFMSSRIAWVGVCGSLSLNRLYFLLPHGGCPFSFHIQFFILFDFISSGFGGRSVKLALCHHSAWFSLKGARKINKLFRWKRPTMST